MTLRIATWNVNSVKSRLAHLLEWLRREQPGIVLLQELKCTDDNFPAMEIEDLGYNLAVYGQKTYNGVAILSKFPLSDIERGLPGDSADEHARYIEAVVNIPLPLGEGSAHSRAGEGLSPSLATPSPLPSPRGRVGFGVLRVASVYVPNGSEASSDKFAYKLRFLDRLHAHCQKLLTYQEMLVIGGDYNIAPTDADVHNPSVWQGSVLTHDEVRSRLRKIIHLGMYDAQILTSHQPPATNHYTWWDYRAGALEKDDGLRIDHLLLSPQAADCLKNCVVKKELRMLERASDHAPVVMEMDI